MPASATACSGATSGSSSWMIERPAGSGAGLREACAHRAAPGSDRGGAGQYRTGQASVGSAGMDRESRTVRAALKKRRTVTGQAVCGARTGHGSDKKQEESVFGRSPLYFRDCAAFGCAAQLHLVEYRAVVDNRATGRRCAAEPVAERVSSGGTPASRADWACRARTSAARAFR